MLTWINQLLLSRTAFPPSLYNGLPTEADGSVKIEKLTDFIVIVSNLIQLLIAVATVLGVIFVIWAGIQYITSSGDPGKTRDARNGLTNAIVGIIIAGGAYAIVEFLARQF